MVDFYCDGKSIDYTPSVAVAGGTVVIIGGMVCVAKSDIAAGALGALANVGVFAFPKKDEAFVAGLPVFFDIDGDPKGGTAGSGAATQLCSDAQAAGDYPVGTCVIGAAAADTVAYIAINKFNPKMPTLSRIKKTANANAIAGENGVCYEVTADAACITLPATVVGLEFTVMNMAADGAAGIDVDFQAADKNIGGCGFAAGGDGKKLTNTKATAKKGDYIKFVADGADGYRIAAIRGIWAQEA
jgi:predicted RecA/RadA family phage recombinase